VRRTALALAALVATGAAVVGCGGGEDASRAGGRGTAASSARAGADAPARPALVTGRHDRPVPILMYHVINRAPASSPYPDLWVSAQDFEDQMRALARAGYHGVTLDQVDAYWRRGVALPAKPVVVSFDDGYLSHYTKALPVLRSVRWPGVLNLELNNVGRGGISARMVRALIAAGWEIDSHTIDHPDLTTLAPDRLRHELVDSRAEIRRRFGVPANFFCYPSGRFNATVVAAVRAAGYRGATTTDSGLGRPGSPFTLRRIRVNAGDGADGLLRKLAS